MPGIAWAITGAGYLLAETFSVMKKATKSRRVKVTTFLSSAGAEVVKMYGLWDELRKISPGSYYEEVLTEQDEGASSPRAGRLARGMYAALVVSPASANTVAKIVSGIADSLVTNAVAQAQKGGTAIFVVPTDQRIGYVETTIPPRVDRDLCETCSLCSIVDACQYAAITLVDGKPRIDLLECHGCGSCASACPLGAVKCDEKVRARVRRVDAENVERLKGMEGIAVLVHPGEIEEVVSRLLK